MPAQLPYVVYALQPPSSFQAQTKIVGRWARFARAHGLCTCICGAEFSPQNSRLQTFCAFGAQLSQIPIQMKSVRKFQRAISTQQNPNHHLYKDDEDIAQLEIHFRFFWYPYNYCITQSLERGGAKVGSQLSHRMFSKNCPCCNARASGLGFSEE